MNWNEISVSTTTQGTEIVSNILLETGSKGIMIEDPSDFDFQKSDPLAWDYVDESVFDYGHEDVKVIGYFSQEENVGEKVALLKNRFSTLEDIGLDLGSLEISVQSIQEENWANEWKKYFDTQKVSDAIVIKPSWKEYGAKEGEKVIEIDPGMAFGTGTHETTRMCIQAIEKYLKKNQTLIDIGCGSGILSIAGGVLGAGKVIAVDLDKLAVKVSKENVHLNGLDAIVEVRQGDLTQVIQEKADIIVANIMADIVAILSKTVRDFMKEGGLFISSGIINDKVDFVQEELKKNGFEVVEVKNEGEWNCIVAR